MKEPADYVGLERALDCPIMSSATDHELAAEHRVSVAYVRERRRIRREDLFASDVRQLAREVAELNGWADDSAHDTILAVLRAAKLAALAERAARSADLYRQLRARLERGRPAA